MYTDPYLYNREPGVRTCFPQDHPKSIISDQDFLNEGAPAVLHDTMMQSNRGDVTAPGTNSKALCTSKVTRSSACSPELMYSHLVIFMIGQHGSQSLSFLFVLAHRSLFFLSFLQRTKRVT